MGKNLDCIKTKDVLFVLAMTRTYTLKEVATILSATKTREEIERIARQIRHWTLSGVLEPEGEKHTGTGRSRRYSADEIRFAAWLMELARYGVTVSIMLCVRYAFDDEAKEGYWASVATADPPVFFEMAWDQDTIVTNVGTDPAALITRKTRHVGAAGADGEAHGVLDPANITSSITVNLTKVFARLDL